MGESPTESPVLPSVVHPITASATDATDHSSAPNADTAQDTPHGNATTTSGRPHPVRRPFLPVTSARGLGQPEAEAEVVNDATEHGGRQEEVYAFKAATADPESFILPQSIATQPQAVMANIPDAENPFTGGEADDDYIPLAPGTPGANDPYANVEAGHAGIHEMGQYQPRNPFSHRSGRAARMPRVVPVSFPMPLADYVSRYRLTHLDARRLEAVPEHAAEGKMNRVAVWTARWRHRNCTMLTQYAPDLVYLRHDTEREYERRLGEFLLPYRSGEGYIRVEVNTNLFLFGPSAHNMMILGAFYGDNASTETRIRLRDNGFLISDTALEFHHMRNRDRRDLFPQVHRGWRTIEAPRYLCVPTPPSLAYYGSWWINAAKDAAGECRRQTIMAVAITEFVAMAFIRWLQYAAFGVLFEAGTADAWLLPQDGYPVGRLMRLSPVLWARILDLDWHQVLAGTPFSPAEARECYYQMARNRWLIDRDYAIFDWILKRIVDVDERTLRVIRRSGYRCETAGQPWGYAEGRTVPHSLSVLGHPEYADRDWLRPGIGQMGLRISPAPPIQIRNPDHSERVGPPPMPVPLMPQTESGQEVTTTHPPQSSSTPTVPRIRLRSVAPPVQPDQTADQHTSGPIPPSTAQTAPLQTDSAPLIVSSSSSEVASTSHPLPAPLNRLTTQTEDSNTPRTLPPSDTGLARSENAAQSAQRTNTGTAPTGTDTPRQGLISGNTAHDGVDLIPSTIGPSLTVTPPSSLVPELSLPATTPPLTTESGVLTPRVPTTDGTAIPGAARLLNSGGILPAALPPLQPRAALSGTAPSGTTEVVDATNPSSQPVVRAAPIVRTMVTPSGAALPGPQSTPTRPRQNLSGNRRSREPDPQADAQYVEERRRAAATRATLRPVHMLCQRLGLRAPTNLQETADMLWNTLFELDRLSGVLHDQQTQVSNASVRLDDLLRQYREDS